MPLFKVEDEVMVKPNRVYVIPLNKDMVFMNSSLQLLEHLTPISQRFSIDFPLRSLVQDHHEWSICIILSGAGNDGTLGLKYIKVEGSMAMILSIVSCQC
jgi:two-component system CheB/CheR fusion protein